MKLNPCILPPWQLERYNPRNNLLHLSEGSSPLWDQGRSPYQTSPPNSQYTYIEIELFQFNQRCPHPLDGPGGGSAYV